MALALFLFWLVLQPYLTPIVLAGTLALVFQPLYLKLRKSLRSDAGAAMATVLVVIMIVFVPLAFFGARIFTEATSLYGSLTSNGGYDLGAPISKFLQQHFSSLNLPDVALNFNGSARQALSWFTQNLGPLSTGIGQALFGAFLSLLGLFYFLKDGAKLKRWMFSLVPLAPEYKEEILREIRVVTNSVIEGTLIVAIIQGVAAGIGFAIFGIPNPIFWASLVVLFTPIPIIGTWLVVLPAVAYLFFIGNTALSIGLLVWSVILVNVIYNTIAPELMHRGNDIHPYVILLSILGGISFFGPIGFLVGPLIAALLFSLFTIYPSFMLGRRLEERD